MRRPTPPNFAHEHFRAAEPPRVVQDEKLGGPAWLLGHWVDEAGRVVAHHVQPLGSRRRLFEIRELPPAVPATPREDDR